MALIETNFIRPQEVYDRNTGESKVRYRSYDGNDRFIPVVEGEKGVPKTMVEVTHAELKAMRDGGKLTAGSLYRITDYNCTTTQENTQSAGHQFDIVLLALSENKLAEEGWAMEHPTDVYDVTFNDGVTKKCYLYVKANDDVYLVKLDDMLGYEGFGVDDFDEIDQIEKTATITMFNSYEGTANLTYNYFQNSNLSAWKVWYCLDNDKSRFAWAQEGQEGNVISVTFKDGRNTSHSCDKTNTTIVKDNVTYYYWHENNTHVGCLTVSPNPNIGDTCIFMVGDEEAGDYSITAITGTPQQDSGKGVIYRLIDEFNNDIKYDFKNIQFKRKITNGQYDANGTETWCYTLNVWYNDMCQDASIVGNTLQNDKGYVTGVYDNIFGYTTAYDLSIEGVNTFAFALGNNVVLSHEDDGYIGINSNTIGNNFYSNTIGNDFYSNTIGNGFYSNTIGNDFYSNMIGNFFNGKTIGDNTSSKNYGNNGVELATKS